MAHYILLISFLFFATGERVVTNLARFVVIIWCFVVLILTQSYTASLSSILTVRQLQPIITDVNLLMKNGDNVGYKSDFIYEMLKERGFQEEKLRKYYTQEELDELLRNRNGNHGISAAFDETPYMKVFLATYCSKYTMVEPTFSTDGFAFVSCLASCMYVSLVFSIDLNFPLAGVITCRSSKKAQV